MGIYANQVLPRIIDTVCGMKESDQYRERVCEGVHGDVMELGFGTGHNIRFYPGAVRSVAAVEPSDTAWKLAAKRVEASPVNVQRSGLDGQALPYDDASFDSAISTWTMCTIPDLRAALAEVRRVLRPGGTLHFVEHGLAPDEKVQRWQNRLNPLQSRIFGGCNLNRDIAGELERAGFAIKEADVFYEAGAPKFLAADTLGVAAV
jgi:ubiquinone/menaquinone biosynthesis C-methylase UbiE